MQEVSNESTIEHSVNTEVPKEYYPTFHGTGFEYFKIWIVNILLSIITLGIYSAWGKVRVLKFFSGSTELDKARFNFHGNPIAILKGRAVAFILFLIGSFSFQLHPFAGLVGIILFYLVLPFLVAKSLKFRIGNTSYRNIRFSFRGLIKDAYKVYLKYLIVPIIAMSSFYFTGPDFQGIAKEEQEITSEMKEIEKQFVNLNDQLTNSPVAQPEVIQEELNEMSLTYSELQEKKKNIAQGFFKNLSIFFWITMALFFIYSIVSLPFIYRDLYNYIYNNIFYGGSKVHHHSTLSSVCKHIYYPYLKKIVALIIIGATLVLIQTYFKEFSLLLLLTVPVFLGVYIGFISLGLYLQVLNYQYIASDQTKLEKAPMINQLKFSKFWVIAVTNVICLVFTLGLFYPWAKVRMRKYKTEKRGIKIANLDNFVGESSESISALGDEVADIFDFDFDIGL